MCVRARRRSKPKPISSPTGAPSTPPRQRRQHLFELYVHTSARLFLKQTSTCNANAASTLHLSSRFAPAEPPTETPLTRPRPATAPAEVLVVVAVAVAVAAGDGLLHPASSTSSSMAAPSLDPPTIESVDGLGEGRPRLFTAVEVAGEGRVWPSSPLLKPPPPPPPPPARLYNGASFCRSCVFLGKRRRDKKGRGDQKHFFHAWPQLYGAPPCPR